MTSQHYDPQKAALLRSVGIGREPDQVTRYKDYGQGAALDAAPVPSWSEYSIETPGRSPHPVADVVVPFLQAVVSGILAGAGAAIGAAKLANVDPALIGSVVGLVVSGVVWSRLLVDSRRLLRKVETWTRQDLDGDGVAGDPGKQETIRLELHDQTEPGGQRTLFEDLPVNTHTFKTWAESVVNGRSLSVSSWTGSGGSFSQSEYEDLMTAMAKARVVEWVNPRYKRQGRQLTTMGEHALRAWLKGA
jgi:hypothetical protein